MNNAKEETYFLYGRKSYEEALEYVESVPISSVEMLEIGDEGWVELIAFPQSAAIQVIPRRSVT